MQDSNSRSQLTNTAGGTYVGRDVNTGGGDFVGHDKVIHGDEIRGDKIVYSGDQAYDVRGLKNPYLGLQAFTYRERDLYAGRKGAIGRACNLLTAPGAERTLLFVTGASGCGKSSFAQAGLLPALEEHYLQQNFIFKSAVFRPGEKPLAGLAVALRTLNLTADGIFAPAVQYQLGSPSYIADPMQVSLLIIDQFEELFTQSASRERDFIFTMLADLPSFRELQLQVIATMRSDYLPDLFDHETLYEIAKIGIDLRAMTEDELKIAIQRPLQALYPNTGKRFQDALLNRLASDASEDAAYLPLLQVTLEDLWRTGLLTVDHYDNLSDAISRSADEVYTNRRDAQGNSQPRTPKEQAAILDIFLALIDVSTDNMQRRDVRRTRRLEDVTRGQRTTEHLVQELATARLLSTDEKELDESGKAVDTVDIIHESLLLNWSLLSAAVQERREYLQQRSRFELRLDEWLKSQRSKGRLLQGLDLAEAENLRRLDDIAIRGSDASDFIIRSIQEKDRIRRRNQRITGSVAAVLGVLLIVAIIAAWQMTVARNDALIAQAAAEAEGRQARAEELAQMVFRRIQELGAADDIALMLARDAVNVTLEPDGYIQPNASIAMVEAVNAAVPYTQIPPGRHSDDVTWAEYSPDGTRIVTASYDGTAKVWDAETEDNLLTLIGHSASVSSAVFSPDGDKIITAGADGTIRLWDASSGAAIATFVNDEDLVTFATFSPSGEQFASADNAGFVRIRNTMTGEIDLELKEHTDAVLSVQFDPDGRKLVTASQDGTARIWNVSNGKELLKFVGHASFVLWATFSPDGELVLTSGNDGAVKLWSTETGDLLGSMIEKRCESEAICDITRATFDPEGNRIISAYFETASIWDVTTFELAGQLSGHTSFLTSINFHPTGDLLVTASEDGTAKVWNVETGEEMLSLGGHAGGVYSAVFNPDGTEVLLTSRDKVPRIWNLTTATERLQLVGHTGIVRSARYNADGTRIVTGSDDGTAKVWDVDSGQNLFTITGHEGRIYSAVYSPDGQTIATVSADKTARLWDADTGEQIHKMAGHTNRLHSADFSPDGRYLVTAAEWAVTEELRRASNTVIVWDTATGMKVRSLEGHADDVYVASYSPDGKRIVTGSADRTARVWDANSGEQLMVLSGHSNWILSAFWNTEGSQIVTAGNDTLIKVWKASTGEELLTLAGHLDGVETARFASSDDQMLTASRDGTVKLWDIRQRNENGRVLRHPAQVEVAKYSPDGSLIASIDLDRTLRIWDRYSGEQVSVYNRPDEFMRPLAFSPDGSQVFIPGQFNPAIIWDLESKTEVVQFSDQPNTLWMGEYSPDGKTIMTMGFDNTLKLWRADTGQELSAFSDYTGDVTFARFSHNGEQIATAGIDGIVRILDVANGEQRQIFEGHSNWVTHVAFNADGSRLASAGTDHTVRVWDVTSGEEILALTTNTVVRFFVDWREDEKRFVTFDIDGNVRVWDYETGHGLLVLSKDGGSFRSAVIAPDGEWVLTASTNGTAREWSVRYEDWLSTLDNLVSRNASVLLIAERQQFGYD